MNCDTVYASFNKSDIRMRSHGLRQLVDKSVASC